MTEVDPEAVLEMLDARERVDMAAMTGSRLVGTIAYEMQRRQLRYGVVTMCAGGGQGGAALFERA